MNMHKWLLAFCLGLAVLVAPKVYGEEEGDEKEEAVAVDKIPDVVKKAATDAIKDFVIAKAEKETKGDKVQYELIGKAGDKIVEIEISAEGKVLKQKDLVKIKMEKEDDDDD